MKFNTKLTTLAATISLTTLLVACGGSGGTDTAGIGGSGFTSSGTITGFGSVFVNGVKFETTNATFDIEGIPGTQNDLAIGMVVQVHGTKNADGITGTATSIVFDDDLQGPIASFTLAPDRLTATFTVFGINVKIDSKTTYFDRDNIEPGVAFDITTIQTGDMVELSGSFDDTGTLSATRIESKENADPEDRNKVEIKGTITNLDPGQDIFTLTNTFTTGITVDTSNIDMSSFQNDNFVEVEGTFDSATQTIKAKKIESEEFEYADNDEYEIEGYITDFTSHRNFKIDGITVDAKDAKLKPSNMLLANNLLVEVEGRFVNGVLIAEEIKMRGGDVEISAPIISIDTANNRFTVEPANGQTLIIQTGTETTFDEDDLPRRMQDLSVSDSVEIEGFLNADGSIFASGVEITDSEEIEIQGIVEDVTLTTVTIIGINFETTAPPEFESDNNSINNLNQLRDSVNAGNQILVKVELPDNNTNVITKIEIED